MPIYEYECGSCRVRFEKKQSFNAKPIATCPECQGKTSRVIHPAPIIFKGSGFYTTDNRKGGGIESDKVKEELPSKKKQEGK